MIHSPLTFNHSLLKQYLKPDSTAIDATVGNGNDFLFLMKQVGNNGTVIGFDIQKDAIKTTQEKIDSNKLTTKTQLILDGHEKMIDYIDPETVHAIVFNLGYLPKGDKTIITKPDTTIKAIEAGLTLLVRGGLMTIMVYHGHDGGSEEKEAVETFLETLDQKEYTVMKYTPLNQINHPPYLLMVQKQ